MFGVLNIHKPEGPTSHDIVSRVRKIFGLKKVGHLGTLDPLAEGVLPVCLGQATRLIEYFPTDKRYTAEVTFGRTTTTLDREGDTVTESPCPAQTAENVQEALPALTGTIDQVVPLHSAVHVKGKKLYEYAQKGQELDVPLPTKSVTIQELMLLEYCPDSAHPSAVLDIKCSSGTYIRSLARDLGDALGTGAYLSKLIRTEHGKFSLDHSVTLDELANLSDPTSALMPPQNFIGQKILTFEDADTIKLLTHGMKVVPEPKHPKLKGNELCYIEWQNQPVGVVQYERKQFKPLKIFMTPEAWARLQESSGAVAPV